MKIESVRIQNFRSFSDVTVSLNDYSCLVGTNGSGKSTVLSALNVFFRETSNVATDLSLLDVEDFHHKNTDEPVCITVTFCDLSEDAQKTFADYFRQGKLVVCAEARYNATTERAEVKQYGERMVIARFKEFFRLYGDNAKASELKAQYAKLQEGDKLPPATTKDAMAEALRAYERERPGQCELVRSEDQFYGSTKGANRLANYLQWVYVPAVKDATTEQTEGKNSALTRLLARTVRAKTSFSAGVRNLREQMCAQYQELLDQNQTVLNDISVALKQRLMDWAHPDASLKLEWRQDKSVRVEEPLARIIAGEGHFEGELARFGHGLQRSYLLALLHELACVQDASAPRLILGCEEPELFQHPPQARHLSAVLQDLSKANSQIIVSTHCPLFVSGRAFEDVRLIRKCSTTGTSGAAWMSYAQVADSIAEVTGEKLMPPQGVLAKIHQLLQPAVSEMFFAKRVIFVEGLEDAAYITTYMSLLERLDDFRRLGCHIVPVNGKSQILQPLIIAKKMGISYHVVFDSDSDQHNQEKRALHERDNRALLRLLGCPDENPLPEMTLWKTDFVMWHSNVTAVVASEIDGWQRYRGQADVLYGHAGDLKKNSLHIGASLCYAWEAGKRSASLERLCEAILVPHSVPPSNPHKAIMPTKRPVSGLIPPLPASQAANPVER